MSIEVVAKNGRVKFETLMWNTCFVTDIKKPTIIYQSIPEITIGGKKCNAVTIYPTESSSAVKPFRHFEKNYEVYKVFLVGVKIVEEP